ncbi:solute carrier family 15 member 2-like [Amblyraja radiata]|uniref:solute carrier family 15 member 2-like n=1 Tax=Amblyraja radiata TaxID=386614 RepID=UPI001401CB67|nr:solute carrier family 15 member 2-like [Amblyraja radiata]
MAKKNTEDETENDPCSPKKQSPRLCGTTYPLSIIFVVVNEFCERFSFYGMKAVLTLYFANFLHWDDDQSTAIYHAFMGLAYFTPVLGALIADSWLGKFKTIVILSIVYIIGLVVTSIGAIPPVGNHTVHLVLSMFGIFLIALGAGCIKPCVAAIGGDQFEEGQNVERRRFFSFFYLCINAGSLLSTIITPILRADVKCFGGECYALAFGVPAALMVVATVVFLSGSGLYKNLPPQGNVLVGVSRCIGFAIRNRWKHRSSTYAKREHWLDWATEKYPEHVIKEIKMVTRVLFLYLPLPMYWALFDQMGSRWTLQATGMNGDFGGFIIQPDQMQTINAILIVTFIPIFDMGIYPLFAKCKLKVTPLRRMTVGMLLTSVAFIAAAFVELQVQSTLVPEPGVKESYVQFLNLADKDITISLQGHDGFPTTMAPSQDPDHYIKLQLDSNNQSFMFDLTYEGRNTTCHQTLSEANAYSILFYNESTNLHCRLLEDEKSKPQKGKATLRFVNAYSRDLNFTLGGEEFGTVESNYGSSTYKVFTRGHYQGTCEDGAIEYPVDLGLLDFGAAYTIITDVVPEERRLKIWKTEDIRANTIHIAWQIPQYVLMAAGEVMFALTGLEFSYSQAPINMKAVLQSGLLLTVAFGNIIVVIVAKSAFLEQWEEFVLFACLLVAVCIIFSIMAYHYTYVDSGELAKPAKDAEEEIALSLPYADEPLDAVYKQTSR